MSKRLRAYPCAIVRKARYERGQRSRPVGTAWHEPSRRVLDAPPTGRCGQAASVFHQATMRSGLSIIELLVVLMILSLLMSLLLPAVVNSRATSRRTQCANNLRNVALAIIQDAEARRRFPASGNFGIHGARFHSWIVNILPGIEKRDIYDRWDFNHTSDSPANSRLGNMHIAILTCPDDSSVVPGYGNLSYVVNGGFGWSKPSDCPATLHVATGSPVVAFDLNGNGVTCNPPSDGSPSDRDVFFQTGLLFVENWPPGSGTIRHHSLDSILDGLSHTLLLTENVRAGYDPYWGDTWASPLPWRNSFFVSGYVCNNAECSNGNVDYNKANDSSIAPYSFEAINSSLSQPEGEAPWPSSYHSGGVNVVLADGSVRFVSQGINGTVYSALVSPQGMKVMGSMSQLLLDIDSY